MTEPAALRAALLRDLVPADLAERIARDSWRGEPMSVVLTEWARALVAERERNAVLELDCDQYDKAYNDARLELVAARADADRLAEAGRGILDALFGPGELGTRQECRVEGLTADVLIRLRDALAAHEQETKR